MEIFKKVLALSLCLCMLALLGCAGQNTQTPTTTATEATEIKEEGPLTDGKTLRVLAVSSSFGENTNHYLYDAAKAEGFETVIVGRLYASGCTLQKHLECAQNGTNHYRYTKISTGKWEAIENCSLLYGLKDEDWDIIFLQQSADRAPEAPSYVGPDGVDYVDPLVEYLQKNKTNPNAKFVWNMCWAFQGDIVRDTFEKYGNNQMVMYNTLVDTLKTKIVTKDHFDAIIPTGTAVQNLRTSHLGDNLTKDGLHLNHIGRVLAAYTMLATLTGKPITEINISTFAKDPTENFPIVEITEQDKLAIMEAVNNAIANPYEVTPCTVTEK